jgi:transposase
LSNLYEQLGLDRFWGARLPDSREGTSWRNILQTLVCYRLINPGSEWRLHRQWFEQSAMGDLLGADYSLVEKNALYRCLDKLLAHKTALFDHLRARWQDLFGATFDILLYDLTSTYFESDPPDDDEDKRRFGHSRDKRSDCVQVVIALIVTPEGFPLAYEVLPGNTADNTTLRAFLQKIEAQYGKAHRIWVVMNNPAVDRPRDAQARLLDARSFVHGNCNATIETQTYRGTPLYYDLPITCEELATL